MAFIGFTVPIQAAEQLSKLHEVGEPTPPGDMHVTACYLGKKVGPQKVIRAIQACYAAASSLNPVKMTAALLATFPENLDHRPGVPVLARIVSQDLMDLRAKVAASLDAFGVEYSKKFPDYKPHVTLGFGSEEFPARRVASPVAWTCTHIMIWGGEERLDGLFAGIQLAGKTA